MTAQQPTCDLCGDPTDGYWPEVRTRRPGDHEVETTVALQARYAVSGGRRAADPYPDDQPDPFQGRRSALRRSGGPRRGSNPNATLCAPAASSSTSTPPPKPPTPSRRHHLGPARRGNPRRRPGAPTSHRGQHPVAVAAAVPARPSSPGSAHQPEGAEAFEQLPAAGATIRRIVDRPPDQQIVGVCDCGTRLYAYAGAATCTCPNPTCALRWDVHESRDRMWDAVHGYLYTANEAAFLLMIHGLGGYNRRRWAKRITMWAQRGLITARGDIDGSPAYLFADIYERATRSEDRLTA
jgi:hypothetical protein